MNKHEPLEVVYIYFDTATFDEIARDVKVKNIQIPGDHECHHRAVFQS